MRTKVEFQTRLQKRKRILGTIVTGLLFVSLLGCGQPAQLKTITLTATGSNTGGFFDLKGEGGTLQLSATGNYSGNGSQNITERVTYTATPTGTDLNGFALLGPPQSLMINNTGLVTAVIPFVCSYHDVGNTTPPAYALTGSYQIIATSSNGVHSQPIFIDVASQTGDDPSGACGP